MKRIITLYTFLCTCDRPHLYIVLIFVQWYFRFLLPIARRTVCLYWSFLKLVHLINRCTYIAYDRCTYIAYAIYLPGPLFFKIKNLFSKNEFIIVVYQTQWTFKTTSTQYFAMQHTYQIIMSRMDCLKKIVYTFRIINDTMILDFLWIPPWTEISQICACSKYPTAVLCLNFQKDLLEMKHYRIEPAFVRFLLSATFEWVVYISP